MHLVRGSWRKPARLMAHQWNLVARKPRKPDEFNPYVEVDSGPQRVVVTKANAHLMKEAFDDLMR